MSPAPHNEDSLVVMQKNRSIAVLYGTETGNSEDIAMELADMLRRLHFRTVVDEMDNVKLKSLLDFTLVIFVTSTTGQGEMPGNANKFWKNLRRQSLNKTNCLGKVKFAIFGLGDSSYPRFNSAARSLRNRLLQLGASEFFRAGEGDERHEDGIDSLYLPWYQDLRGTLLAQYLPESLEPIPDDVQLPPRYVVRLAKPPLTTTTMGSDTNPGSSHAITSNVVVTGNGVSRHEDSGNKVAAVLSHVDRPRGSEEQSFDIPKVRKKIPGEFEVFARDDGRWEDKTGLRADYLDKDNVLTDHARKYCLQEPRQGKLGLPPNDELPIPYSYTATLYDNSCMTPSDHWQDVRYLRFKIAEKGQQDELPIINTGTTMVIYPKNFPSDAQTLIDLMGWNEVADRPLEFGVESTISDGYIYGGSLKPSRLYTTRTNPTLRQLLLHNFDITAVPKRSFLRDLVWLTENSMERERLQEMTKMSDQGEFYDYTARPRRTIIEVLQDFPGVKIPLGRVVHLFPLIRGREFSVACGGEDLVGGQDGRDLNIEILVALVKYKTIIKKPREGLCSRYLSVLEPDTRIRVTFNKVAKAGGKQNHSRTDHIGVSDHGLPVLRHDPSMALRPLIAVATGTGIAPIRNFISDCNYHVEPGGKRGPVVLFFGCRSKNADYYFQEEWEARTAEGDFTVIPAFSRDPVSPELEKTLDPYAAAESWGAPNTFAIGLNETNAEQWARQTGGYPLDPQNAYNTGMQVYDYDRGKNYVQHHIRHQAQRLGPLLRDYPVIMVCGNSGRMPLSVWNALRDVVVTVGIQKTRDDADKWLKNPKNVTFWQETW